mgnify:CR=1 FL=1
MTKHDKEVLQELSKEQLIYLIEQMKSSLCKIGEACVEESKDIEHQKKLSKILEDIFLICQVYIMLRELKKRLIL